MKKAAKTLKIRKSSKTAKSKKSTTNSKLGGKGRYNYNFRRKAERATESILLKCRLEDKELIRQAAKARRMSMTTFLLLLALDTIRNDEIFKIK